MVSNFERWEKDPFFSAAEEVQESADRMESTYRMWIHAKKDTSGTWNFEELCRDLHTSLGTCKWQLEEFERAVESSYANSSTDNAKERHREFIVAMESQILRVENSLHESAISTGKPPLPWVRLEKGESHELALFLSGPSASGDKTSLKILVKNQPTMKQHETETRIAPQHSKNLSDLVEWEAKEEKFPGYRRTASASADIGAWKIAVDDEAFPQGSSNVQPEPTPRKIPSFSGFLNTMESASKLTWSKNCYRKLKLMDRLEADTLPKSEHLTKGINACCERSKRCLEGCDNCYDKQLYGWYGAIQRHLQRSQYHMQYGRPAQVVFLTVLLLCFIVLFAFCVI